MPACYVVPVLFTLGVLAAVAAAILFPGAFHKIAGIPGTALITPLTQVVMFGMGVTLTIGDFARVGRMRRAALIGAALQFTVMPLAGWALSQALRLPPTLAVGVILVGSWSGGASSNVITYVARGSVALSVTMTAFSTLLAPLATPPAMKPLAAQTVTAPFSTMMLSILEMIVVAMLAGLAVSRFLPPRLSKLLWAAPVVSMALLCFIIAIGTATSHGRLLSATAAIALAAVAHNGIGYLLGYGAARAARLDETVARSVSVEVGLQNAGMAIGLAFGALNSSEAALPAVAFGAWMNISGSALAAFWRRRPLNAPEHPC
jgi:bile acid:Na+ symporter, BASS family